MSFKKRSASVALLLIVALFAFAALMVLTSKPARAADRTCPEVYTLKVNVWPDQALTLDGVSQTHRLEQSQQTFIGMPHVSQKHGGQFRKALASGQLQRSATEHRFRVSFIMTPEARGGSPIIASEHVIRDITVVGLLELKFDRNDLEIWDAIRVVALGGGILSPPQYGATGVHELRFFNRLPGTVLGEWDSNPVPDCIMNEHWVGSEK